MNTDELLEELEGILSLSNPNDIVNRYASSDRSWPAFAGTMENRMWMVNNLIEQLIKKLKD